jgi:hypothetical protein
MNLRRALLIAVAVCAVAIGSISFGMLGLADTGVEQTAAACARCGDGVCARSCENERTCPADCKAVKSAAEMSSTHDQPR